MFLIEKGGKPKRLPAATFQTEDEFQRLMADFPELLTDADFGEGSPRKWLLVTREAMVPDSQDGSGRWSLDHLFLDQAEYSYFAYRRIISHFQLIWSYASSFQDGCTVRGGSLKYIFALHQQACGCLSLGSA
jgi:hypothetical protein